MDQIVNSYTQPLVTVLMPVYNAEDFLREAIDSILTQTYTNFEFLIIDDGSNDNSDNIISSYKDERIRYRKNERNLALIATLNKGFELANGKYIVRMDADDVSMPMRLEKQIEILENNAEIGVVGCWIKRFGAENKIVEFPTQNDEMKASMFFFNPISHPGVTIRKSLIDENQLKFNKHYLHAEDYHFWFQCFQLTQFYNIPEVLLNYRVHPQQMGFIAPKASLDSTRKIKREALTLFGETFSVEEENEWVNIVYNQPSFDQLTIHTIEKVIESNRIKKVVNEEILERKLAKPWKNSFLVLDKISKETYKIYTKSPMQLQVVFTTKQKLSILKKRFINNSSH
jgi:glycosyltransferase involved in cell wall biosynthesis